LRLGVIRLGFDIGAEIIAVRLDPNVVNYTLSVFPQPPFNPRDLTFDLVPDRGHKWASPNTPFHLKKELSSFSLLFALEVIQEFPDPSKPYAHPG
jgi:hypothetical protein